MNHHATPAFWECLRALPGTVRNTASRAFDLLRDNPQHPSLHLKRVGRFWSVRVGLHHRALGVDAPDGVVWFWVGSHADYDKLVG